MSFAERICHHYCILLRLHCKIYVARRKGIWYLMFIKSILIAVVATCLSFIDSLYMKLRMNARAPKNVGLTKLKISDHPPFCIVYIYRDEYCDLVSVQDGIVLKTTLLCFRILIVLTGCISIAYSRL